MFHGEGERCGVGGNEWLSHQWFTLKIPPVAHSGPGWNYYRLWSFWMGSSLHVWNIQRWRHKDIQESRIYSEQNTKWKLKDGFFSWTNSQKCRKPLQKHFSPRKNTPKAFPRKKPPKKKMFPQQGIGLPFRPFLDVWGAVQDGTHLNIQERLRLRFSYPTDCLLGANVQSVMTLGAWGEHEFLHSSFIAMS